MYLITFVLLGFFTWQQSTKNAMLRRDFQENADYLLSWEEAFGRVKAAGPLLNSNKTQAAEVDIRHILTCAREVGLRLRNIKPSRATSDRPASLGLEVRKTDLKPLVAFLAAVEKQKVMVTGLWLSQSQTSFFWEARIAFGCAPDPS